jgi:hypothetical protein
MTGGTDGTDRTGGTGPPAAPRASRSGGRTTSIRRPAEDGLMTRRTDGRAAHAPHGTAGRAWDRRAPRIALCSLSVQAGSGASLRRARELNWTNVQYHTQGLMSYFPARCTNTAVRIWSL